MGTLRVHSPTDTPLNVASGQALAQVIHQNGYSPDDTIGGAQVDPTDLDSASPILHQLGLGTLPFVTDAALAAAAKVLPPAPVAALRQLLEQQLAAQNRERINDSTVAVRWPCVLLLRASWRRTSRLLWTTGGTPVLRIRIDSPVAFAGGLDRSNGSELPTYKEASAYPLHPFHPC